MLSAARRSRFGVGEVVDLAPRKPIRSARAESTVISTRFGFWAAANEWLAKERQRNSWPTMVVIFRANRIRIITVSVKGVARFLKIDEYSQTRECWAASWAAS